LKGVAAVAIARILIEHVGSRTEAIDYLEIAALFAIIGHVFPVWLNFRGGKGVATGLGSFVLIAPKAVLIAAAIFVFLVATFRYVSLGSIISVAAFPFIVWWMGQLPVKALTLVAVASLLIIAKHHQNIGRLLAGTENRIKPKRA
jgi:acyl phosphate:glycerol-3-phosphate acyltransferase